MRFFYVKVCVLKLIHYLYTIIITIKNNNIMNYLKNKIFRDFILDLKKSDITDFYMHIVDEIAIKSIYVEDHSHQTPQPFFEKVIVNVLDQYDPNYFIL